MGLEWVRVDVNIATHDKVLQLMHAKDGPKAFTLYICGLGYAGGHDTDGFVPKHALPILHGSERVATTLIDHGLWEYDPGGQGYRIRNFAERQQLAMVTEMKKRAGRKGNCIRWHGPGCGCWKRD